MDFILPFFCMYIRCASKELGIGRRNILLYVLCILYILSTTTVFLDTTLSLLMNKINLGGPEEPLVFRYKALDYTSNAINGMCDFISQGILIYRCWVIWDRNIHVVIIPSVFSLVFLATWLGTDGSSYMVPYAKVRPIQINRLGRITISTSLVISLTVNAVITGLIVFRILKVCGDPVSFGDRTSGAGGAEVKLRSIILIIIESGMAMFIVQIIRVVFTILNMDAAFLVIGIHEMFNGLTPTITLLRLSAGLSCHNEKSMVETAASWKFAPHNQNPISETEGIENMGQGRVGPIGFQQGDDIQIIDR